MARGCVIRVSTSFSLQRFDHIEHIAGLQLRIGHFRGALGVYKADSRLVMRVTSTSRQVPRVVHVTGRYSRRTNKGIRHTRTHSTRVMSRHSHRSKGNLGTQPRRRLSVRNLRPQNTRIILLPLRNFRLHHLLNRNLHNFRTNSQLIGRHIRVTLLIQRRLVHTTLRVLRCRRPHSRRQRRRRTRRHGPPVSRRRSRRHSRRNRCIKGRVSRTKARHIKGHIRVVSRTGRSFTIQAQVRVTRQRHLGVHRGVTTRIFRRRLASTDGFSNAVARSGLVRRGGCNRRPHWFAGWNRVFQQGHTIGRSFHRV